jgi:shikimate kinase
VIATGGGIVQNPENWLSLAQNGRIYFVDRPVGLLETDGRPLSKDRKTVQALYDRRIALYSQILRRGRGEQRRAGGSRSVYFGGFQ